MPSGRISVLAWLFSCMRYNILILLFMYVSAFAAFGLNPQGSILMSDSDTITTQLDNSKSKKIKRGWNFGILPDVSYDADLGFQGGILTNIYDYGDGSYYPDYRQMFFFEAAYSTKHYGTLRFNYDTRHLIPNHHLSIDATYLPDAMCDFYGFNGYQSKYQYEWHHWSKNPKNMDTIQYVSRAFYKYRRDFFRLCADIDRDLSPHWKVNLGIGVLGYLTGRCDFARLNATILTDSTRYLNPDIECLYDKYVRWGLIDTEETKGGWHPYVRFGAVYDSRDQQACPTEGIYTDAFFTYSAAFNSAAFGNQAAAGYNHLRFNFTFRHYLPVYRNRVIFAYRIGTQNILLGRSPYYLNTYLNTLFIQRVLYEGLGGGNSLRGVLRNRILAKGYAYTNIEFRFRLYDFDLFKQHFYIGVNPFFDMGIITQPYQLDEQNVRKRINEANERDHTSDNADEFFSFSLSDVYRPHLSAGIGLKIAMNENFVLSVDWAAAFSRQDSR